MKVLAMTVGLALAVVLSACGTGGSKGSTSCVAVVEWNGREYVGGVAPDGVRLSVRLGRGVMPGCNDTVLNGKPANEPSQPVTLWKVQGVPSTRAVAIRYIHYPIAVYTTRLP